jgi:hypothetical protein
MKKVEKDKQIALKIKEVITDLWNLKVGEVIGFKLSNKKYVVVRIK